MPRLSSAHVKHVSQQENIVHVLCTMYVGPSTGHCCNSNTCEALSIALCMYIWDQLQALQPHTAQKNKPALNEIDASESLGQAEAPLYVGPSASCALERFFMPQIWFIFLIFAS